MKPIGKVIHYYDKVGVAVIRLQNTLKLGDRVRIEKGDNAFEQEITSMQINFKPVELAESDEEVAVKVEGKAKEGALVLLSEEE